MVVLPELFFGASKHFPCVEALLAADGINPNLAGGYFEDTPLIAAAVHGNDTWTKHFIGVHGVQVNHMGRDGWTALMHTTEGGTTAGQQNRDMVAIN